MVDFEVRDAQETTRSRPKEAVSLTSRISNGLGAEPKM